MADDQRKHARVKTSFEVELTRGDATAQRGQATDLSLGGMFVSCAGGPPPFGAAVEVTLGLVGEGPPGVGANGARLLLPAVVRWTTPAGVGLQFGRLGAKETAALLVWVRWAKARELG